MILLASLSLQDSAPHEAKPNLDGLRREFERAYEAEDGARIETLVRENPTLCDDLFKEYARVWIDVAGEPGSREMAALAKAWSLAEAVDSALEAPALLDAVNALQTFDAGKRARFHDAESAMRRGEDLLNRFDALGAKAEYQRGLELYQELGWSVALLDNLSLTTCLGRLGAYRDAKVFDENLLTAADQMGDPLKISRALHNLAGDCTDLGDYARGITYYERSLALSEGEDLEAAAASAGAIGSCYDELGHYDRALSYLMKALTLSERSGGPREIGKALNDLGNHFGYLDQHLEAIDYFERALVIAEQLGNPRNILGTHHNLAVCYREMRDLDRARQHLEKARHLAERSSNPADVAVVDAECGRCAATASEHDQAITYLTRALENEHANSFFSPLQTKS